MQKFIFYSVFHTLTMKTKYPHAEDPSSFYTK